MEPSARKIFPYSAFAPKSTSDQDTLDLQDNQDFYKGYLDSPDSFDSLEFKERKGYNEYLTLILVRNHERYHFFPL